jgi:hypothetical protein
MSHIDEMSSKSFSKQDNNNTNEREGRQGAVVFNEKRICTSSTNFKARLLECVGFFVGPPLSISPLHVYLFLFYAFCLISMVFLVNPCFQILIFSVFTVFALVTFLLEQAIHIFSGIESNIKTIGPLGIINLYRLGDK